MKYLKRQPEQFQKYREERVFKNLHNLKADRVYLLVYREEEAEHGFEFTHVGGPEGLLDWLESNGDVIELYFLDQPEDPFKGEGPWLGEIVYSRSSFDGEIDTYSHVWNVIDIIKASS